jgi:hypothetical protein
LFRWKQDLVAPGFVAVQITDEGTPSGAPGNEGDAS